MDTQKELILIDTNIFVIDLRYKRDSNFEKNQAFLSKVAQSGNGFTTIVNLLELCGILSFNLHQTQLLDLWTFFQDKFNVTVLPSLDLKSKFPGIELKRVFDLLCKKSSFGDALMVVVAEKYLTFITTMVTWDSDHLKDKFNGDVLTPAEFISD